MGKSSFLESVRYRLRRLNYALRTEDSYVSWIRQYIVFHNKQHPATLGKEAMEQFLTWLAVERKVDPPWVGDCCITAYLAIYVGVTY